MPITAVLLRGLAPLLAGILITLSFAPFFLWPLGILGCLLMAWVWRDLSPRQAAFSGWLFGLGLFGAGTSWVYVSIHVYGYAPIPLAVFLTLLFVMGLALFPALQGWLLARFFHRHRAWLLLSFPALWVLLEWLRTWFLTGFPWLFLGNAHIESPLAGWAPVIGVYGVSFIVAFTAAAILVALTLRNRPSVLLLILVLGAWISGAFMRSIDWSLPSGAPLRVAMVQGNIAQELKWLESERQKSIRTYWDLSAPYWGYDLVLWPETAVPVFLQEAEPVIDALDEEAKLQGSTLVTGIPTAYPQPDSLDYRIHNSIIARGEGSGVYHKQKLVPFGEYVPLESVLRGLIDFFNLPMSSFTAGDSDQAPLRIGNLTAIPFICYEVVYPDFVAGQVKQADVMLTISNDSWFGDSFGPHQHLQISQMRALENARYMVRGTNNGISAVINEKGQVLGASRQFVQEVLTGEAVPLQGNTPFSITGSVPILVVVTVLGLLARDTRKRARPASA